MKKLTILPALLHRSLLAAGVGCALTVCTVSAQESKKGSAPTTAGETDTDQNKTETDRLHTDSTVPRKKASEKAETELTNKEKQFLNKALVGNTVQVMMAELAIKKTENPDVKSFAEKMVAEHKKANSELSEIDDAHGSSVPSPNPTGEDKAQYAQMTSLSGTAFDTAYAKRAVTTHEEDIKEYQQAKADTNDKMLMAYIDKTLPHLEKHLQMAQMLKKDGAVVNH